MPPVRFHDILPETLDEIGKSIECGHSPVIQFGSMPNAGTLDRLDEFCRRFGPDLQVRFYGFAWREMDTSFLNRLPHVANLSIDTIRSISDFAPVTGLERLTRLRFGVHEQPDGKFLEHLDLSRFTHLTLAANKSRNYDLSPLASAVSLKRLFVQGHCRGIAHICALAKLSEVTLSGFPKRQDLAFLNDLRPLRSLFLILGSRTSIAEFAHASLLQLRLVLVRTLEDLGPLQRFNSLEELEIEDQIRLRSLDITGLSLRRLKISNCKTLNQIIGLETQTRHLGVSIHATGLPSSSET